MVKVLVLYRSMYGHIETMAHQVAAGARSVPGVGVTVKCVPETMNAEAFKAAGGKSNQSAAVARQPDARELGIARHQGEYVVKITAKLKS